LRKLFTIAALLLFFISTTDAQVQNITINSITVEGNINADASSIRLNTGLVAGQSITGEDIQKAIKNLWALQIFDDIQIYVTSQTVDGIDLLIKVKEYKRLEKVNITGADELSDDEKTFFMIFL